MKKLFSIITLCAIAGTLAGCSLYTPEKTYTYWRYNATTQMYAPVRSEYQIDEIALKEEGLVSKLPENAKTTEPQ